jgi:hypothetical protein
MGATMYRCQKLSQAIDELPDEVLPELSEFIHYLQYKTAVPYPEIIAKPSPGSALLLAIAGIGESVVYGKGSSPYEQPGGRACVRLGNGRPSRHSSPPTPPSRPPIHQYQRKRVRPCLLLHRH